MILKKIAVSRYSSPSQKSIVSSVRQTLSLEDLRTNIKERFSINEVIDIPLEKGENNIYFSLRDNIRPRRLRKLEIIRIK